MGARGKGKSHQKKIEKFKARHPEGRKVYAKKKKDLREEKRKKKLVLAKESFLQKHPEGKVAYKSEQRRLKQMAKTKKNGKKK